MTFAFLSRNRGENGYNCGADVTGNPLPATVFAAGGYAPLTSPALEVYPNSVYKYYDSHGILIYVGITKTGILRNRQHNSDKPWWSCVARQDVEHLDSRESAQAREIELIRQFRPPFNIQHNPDHAEIREAYITLGQSGKLGISLKAAMRDGVRRAIKLSILRRELHHVVFSSNLADAPLTAHLKHVSGVKVVSQHGQIYGKVTRIKTEHPFATIWASFKMPLEITILGSEGRLKYMSVKEPIEMRLSSIRIILG